jgi:hypothetical protein
MFRNALQVRETLEQIGAVRNHFPEHRGYLLKRFGITHSAMSRLRLIGTFEIGYSS